MLKRIITLLGLLALIVSCSSTPIVIDEGLSPNEFFQRAQKYFSEKEDYDSALLYYKTFTERFPEDTQRLVEAEYEIAYIYYVMNDYAAASNLFTELLAKYQGDGAKVLPKWPRILSEKLLIIINESTAIQTVP